jgi:predicted transcriptional regulator
MAREPIKLQPSRTGKKSVSVHLSPEKWREVKILAVTTDTTIDAIMRRALDLVVAEHRAKAPKRHAARPAAHRKWKRAGSLGRKGSLP